MLLVDLNLKVSRVNMKNNQVSQKKSASIIKLNVEIEIVVSMKKRNISRAFAFVEQNVEWGYRFPISYNFINWKDLRKFINLLDSRVWKNV